ncbi:MULTISPECIES: HlyD family secretion protein [Tenebrionibacter/Tenebrionicola group]|jgi:membrane fusion protein|uniref:HlyD family efflux transporter periplasmic adaptor subunit n=2 Tax=Tenebrionibacter/Tenebrionicola group TaxID=2969848 RepID=A0A8K0V1A0_9ENTR|nr:MULTISPECIES: HlyD family efflux transporter periplasmic adaptor subunit [Tenebrionibacter/Tenebrionicola group]MBK4715102.1 HlyD family efflux transporter periplasmic adaptor subunit [Tenebrionibacter intestinalis]MBV4414024.1 HlyD family efflux transporter periplasmic adaptor subunit [Tenebrionicola larvae]MBV5096238.1 HlyD family efflux transporter periplasmic adaptor subunit [Tenebrionicola larvae]
MSESLFRKEALEANKSKAIGSVALYCPPYRWVIVGLVGLITVATLVFFFFGTYTKRETATGALIPVEGVMDIVAINPGTVTELSINEGDSVEKGAPLITISSEVATKYGQTRETIAEQLELQHDMLIKERANLYILSEETRKGLEDKKRLLEQQLRRLSDIYASRMQQTKLAAEKVNKYKMMRKEGYASNSQVEEQETARLEAESRLQDVARQRIDLQQQLTQTQQQIREQPINVINKANDIDRRLAELKQNLMENESRRSVVLNAPQKATVASVVVKRGQIVANGQTVASLLPENTELQARIMVSSRAIGFIQAGQRVVLRYQAYPWQKFGQQLGKVVEVSRVALSPQEVAQITGNNQVQEQHYLVKVKLDNQFIKAYGKPVRLQPGSAVEADFLIDKRRLYEWVLEPLYALARSTSS